LSKRDHVEEEMAEAVSIGGHNKMRKSESLSKERRKET
jgi:hypothetical protein